MRRRLCTSEAIRSVPLRCVGATWCLATATPSRAVVLRGAAKNSCRRRVLDHLALHHEQHPVGEAAGDRHLVGRDHAASGRARRAGGWSLITSCDELRVERAGRFVEQHHARRHRQRTRDRHPLLLSAGELVGIRRLLPSRPTCWSRSARQRRGLAARHAEHVHGPAMTLSSAVRWRNRLKLWNTMPIRRRWRLIASSANSCSRSPSSR